MCNFTLPLNAQRAKIRKTEAKVKMITTPVPVRPAGQKDVLGLVTPKMDVVRVT